MTAQELSPEREAQREIYRKKIMSFISLQAVHQIVEPHSNILRSETDDRLNA